jgi:hypothetical protein
MTVSKHGNWDYSAGVPINDGDLYYSPDKIRDFQYSVDQAGQLSKALTGTAPIVLQGGVVTQGAGDTLNITACLGLVYYSVTIPDTFAAFPPSTTTADALRFVESTVQTNLAIPSATLNGVAVNYIKLRFAEINGNTRTKAYAAGTYAYERIPSFTFTVSTVVPDAKYDLCLGTLVGSAGGTFTFLQGLSTGYVNPKANDRSYVVAPGCTIAANDVVEYINGGVRKLQNMPEWLTGSSTSFFSGSATYYSVAALSSTKICVCYVGTDTYGYAFVVTVNDTSIERHPAVAFNAVFTGYLSAVALSATSVCVAYQNGSTSYGNAIVLTITGTVVTFGSIVAFNATITTDIAMVALSATSVCVMYHSSATYGTAIILTITGTVITYGTPVAFTAVEVSGMSAVALSATSVCVVYQNKSTTYGNAIILTIAGTVITYGTPVAFNAVATTFISAVALFATSVCVSYINSSTTYGNAIILTIAGTVITYGTPLAFHDVSTTLTTAIALSSTTVCIIFRNDTNSIGNAIQLLISGTTITSSNVITFGIGFGDYSAAVAFSSTNIFCFYRYSTTAAYGITLNLFNHFKNVTGISKQAQTTGKSCIVGSLRDNVITGLSGLTPNAQYFCDEFGNLIAYEIPAPLGAMVNLVNLKPKQLFVGTAIDATTLLIENIKY